MKYIMIIYVGLGIALFGFNTELQAQGCSDAGICTIENIKPGVFSEKGANQIRVGIGYGNADHGIAVVTPYVAYSRTFDKLTLETRLTSISQSGPETSNFGMSDIYLVGNYSLSQNLKVTLGVKLPLSDANRLLDGKPLPMDYQSSLGTVDLLLGVQYNIKKLMLGLAYQQPLSQNSNSFLVEDYPADSDFSKFQSTNNYVRRGDVLIRVSYPLTLGKAVVLTPSLLPIYHLASDKYTDLLAQEQEIIGSQGLTLNFNVYVDVAVGSQSNLQISMGTPFIVRDARPDGLTRSFVANLEYQISF